MNTMKKSKLEQYLKINKHMRDYIHDLFRGCCSTHVDYPELVQINPVSWIDSTGTRHDSVEIVMSDYSYENTKMEVIPKKVFMGGNAAYEAYIEELCEQDAVQFCEQQRKEMQECKQMVLKYPDLAKQVLKIMRDKKPDIKNDLSEYC